MIKENKTLEDGEVLSEDNNDNKHEDDTDITMDGTTSSGDKNKEEIRDESLEAKLELTGEIVNALNHLQKGIEKLPNTNVFGFDLKGLLLNSIKDQRLKFFVTIDRIKKLKRDEADVLFKLQAQGEQLFQLNEELHKLSCQTGKVGNVLRFRMDQTRKEIDKLPTLPV